MPWQLTDWRLRYVRSDTCYRSVGRSVRCVRYRAPPATPATHRRQAAAAAAAKQKVDTASIVAGRVDSAAVRRRAAHAAGCRQDVAASELATYQTSTDRPTDRKWLIAVRRREWAELRRIAWSPASLSEPADSLDFSEETVSRSEPAAGNLR